jgi:signal transduction histidine kinase/ActR/RegA family two-component response regulator
MNYLQQVIAAFDDPIFIFDHEGHFSDCFNFENKPMLLPPEAFMGKHYRDVLPAHITAMLDAAITRVGRGEVASERFEYQIELEGEAMWFSCTLKPFPAPEDGILSGYSAIIQEVTGFVDQRFSIHRKEQALIASAIANEALLKNRNVVHAASIGLRELGLAMKADRCYMFRITWNDKLQENVSNQLLEWTNDFAEPQINNPELQDVPFSLAHPFMNSLLENKPFVCIVSQLPDCGLHEILSMQNIQSLVALPIWVDEQLWGFVGFDDCQRERDWSNADISILASFATSIANAVLRGKTEDNLEKARFEAESANKAKSIFLSNITHEIRTPLHRVIGYAEMLSHFPFPHPEDEYFNNIKLSANTLYELINNILDFSKIEAGVFEMSPENNILDDIIKSAIASVSYLLKSSGNQLAIHFDEAALPDVVHLDATRLKQILVNLLSNALKFSSDNTVDLSVDMLPEGLRFSIRDQGIGLSEEQLTRLFTPFTQFDSSFAKKYQGNGLGLSITRHILNLMGSEPRVESAIGKGSTFSFTLPLQSIAARESKRDLPSPPRADLAEIELDVMVVEDNRLNMLLAETVLRDIAPRIRIHKASNGLEAIKHMESGLAPDIVFMDLQMPIMDGFETTAVIRELYQAPMRIVALTASAISEVRDRCLASGMDEFLTKPFTRDQMAQLLQRHVTGG